MGAPSEQYEQQMIQHVEPINTSPDYYLWATGVLVPIVLAAIPYFYKMWLRRRSEK